MDQFVSCPYDLSHRVPKSRFQGHLVKCEKTHPRLEICPYNATHRYPLAEIKSHISVCPAKEQFLTESKPDQTNAILTTPQPIPQKEYIRVEDPDYESWD